MMNTEDNMPPFNFPIEDKSERIIKVIGVGGGGGNAVQHMWENGVRNVTFIVTNTDSQVLSANKVPNKLLLGPGLGAGGKRDEGQRIAEENIEEIKQMFDDDTKMVFITAGLGGGTGTGATPVIARVARQMGILTIGVVTLPFRMEGRKRIAQALEGLEEIRNCVDSLIVINNERLITDEQYNALTWDEGLKKADEVLMTATKTVAEIITVIGKVNRDFNDVKSVMKDGGAAIVSVGSANGENRIFKALSNAISSSLVANVNRRRVKRMLYVIYSGQKNPARTNELREINEFMEDFSEDIDLLWGLYPDESLDDDIKVAIIATGFDEEPDEASEPAVNNHEEHYKALFDTYYGAPRPKSAQTPAEPAEHRSGQASDAQSEAPTQEPADAAPTIPDEDATPGRLQNILQSVRSFLGRIVDEY